MLRWIPREQNIEADALTNSAFEGFDPGKRINVRFEDFKFEVLDQLMGEAQKMDSEIRLVKSSKERKTVAWSEKKAEGQVKKRREGETRWRDPW